MKWNEVKADDIPIDILYDNSTVQELRQKAEVSDSLLKDIQLPYVKKEITVMSPGVWNNFRYSADAIRYAWEHTDWTSKEVRALFLDHKDERTLDWVGEIQNPKLIDNKIVADLVIVDPATALKVAYGARCGVSPKVAGDADIDLRLMNSFTFENFSIVLNPAVKTAFINNAEIDLTEEERAKLFNKEETLAQWGTQYVNDLPDSSFAWIAPGGEKDDAGKTVPRSLRHLPYKDENGKIDLPHLRNALARISQVKDMPKDVEERIRKELEGILKTKSVENTEENKMLEETKKIEQENVEKDIVAELNKKIEAMAAELKALQEMKLPKAEDDEEEDIEEEDSEFKVEMEHASGALFNKAKALKAANPKMSWKNCIAEAAKGLEDLMMSSEEVLENFSKDSDAKFKALESKINELAAQLSEKTAQVQKLQQEVEEPIRLTKRTEELAQTIEELSDEELDNQMFVMMLDNQGTPWRGEK